MPRKYDLIVVGAGSGGVRAARLAAQSGAKTLIIEGRHWGGTCVNLGCVPKKLLVYASDHARMLQNRGDFAYPSLRQNSSNQSSKNNMGEADLAKPGWLKLIKQVNKETTRLAGLYQNILESNGVTRQSGMAYFTGPNSVAIRGKNGEFHGDKILISTGGRAIKLQVPGKELAMVSDDVFSQGSYPKGELPVSVAIIGGGYIALEFACIYAAFGVKVNLIHRSDVFLRGFDREVAKFALEQIAQNPNIKIMTNTNLVSLSQKNKSEISLKLITNAKSKNLRSEKVLFAVGRRANTDKIDIEKIGANICAANGNIIVDKFYQTKQKHIFALGDVVGNMELTPVAIAEAKKFVAKQIAPVYSSKNAKSKMAKIERVTPLDYSSIPMAVFSRPEVAQVGLSEESALILMSKKKKQVQVYRASFPPMSKTFSKKKNKSKMLIKMICEKEKQTILGVHIVGDGAAEILQGFSIAVKMKLSKDKLSEIVGIHPSSAEEIFTLI